VDDVAERGRVSGRLRASCAALVSAVAVLVGTFTGVGSASAVPLPPGAAGPTCAAPDNAKSSPLRMAPAGATPVILVHGWTGATQTGLRDALRDVERIHTYTFDYSQYANYWASEVFSTDWSFGGGQDECRFGDGADSLRAQSDAAQRLPAGLEQRDPAFSLSA
jgi:hypothetical protein